MFLAALETTLSGVVVILQPLIVVSCASTADETAAESRELSAAVHLSHPMGHPPPGHFPTDEAATKLLYLALRNIIAKWKRPSLA